MSSGIMHPLITSLGGKAVIDSEPATATGAALSNVVPLPSCPALFVPQQYTT